MEHIDSYKGLGPLHSIHKKDNRLEMLYKRGSITAGILDGGAYHICISRTQVPKEYRSYALMPEVKKGIRTGEIYAEPEYGSQKQEERLFSGTAGGIGINRETGGISLYGGEGKLMSRGKALLQSNEYLLDVRELEPGEDWYGFGEKPSPMGRRGYIIDNFNLDADFPHTEVTRKMYVSVPFGISVNHRKESVWGYFIDTPYRTILDIGSRDWELMQTGVFRDDIHMYLFNGDTPGDILESYTDITGRHRKPPLWALGFHQCRYSYMSEKEAEHIGREFRDRDIPCDGIWYDIDYMEGFRVFTFNRETFPSPKKHFKAMKGMGFHPVCIVDPGVKADPPGVYGVCDEGTDEGYFLKDGQGDDFLGEVWPGDVKFPDFTREDVRSWWADQHKVLFEAGVEGIWNDMNEPALLDSRKTIPEEINCYDEGRWSGQDRMHNVYAIHEAEATIEAFERIKSDAQPFILTRGGSPGIQRHAAVWTGDNNSAWEHLRMSLGQIINLGMSGIGFCGADVGGFGENITPELMVRWFQLGAFYPFFRNHSGKETINQEPWVFGSDIEAACRTAVKLRYTLIPYLFEYMIRLHEKGTPVMRPVFWERPSVEYANIHDEFFFGDDIICAPVVEQAKRHRILYLPDGYWYDRESKQAETGSRMYETPLDKIPVFHREGSVIPVHPDVCCTDEMKTDRVHFEVWPFVGGGTYEQSYAVPGNYRDDETVPRIEIRYNGSGRLEYFIPDDCGVKYVSFRDPVNGTDTDREIDASGRYTLDI